jgi:osmoprotectant transport system permease protein
MLGNSWTAFIEARFAELVLRTGEHLMLTGFSTGMAIIVGIPLGICAARVQWMRGSLMSLVGILQTIPSLAMLAILLTLFQRIGVVPAITALTLYALLPIVRNTLTGLKGISPDVLEAARGIGMTSRQQLWLVEIPLSMPVIVAGIRTAAVVGVGIATLSAFIGAGGLGQFINRGLALSNTNLILLGAIPAAILALIVDGTIASFQWGFWGFRQSQAGRHQGRPFFRYRRILALSLPVLLIIGGCIAYFSGDIASSDSSWGSSRLSDANSGPIRIGTKNFTEQLILGELMAQLIETQTRLPVVRRFNLGGTMICHRALLGGEIDVYAEYIGTALTAILKHPVISDPDSAYNWVSNKYRERFGAEWLQPLGFNNTYTIAVRGSDADSLNIKSISDLVSLARSFRAGFTAEFSERPDGYRGLGRVYGIQFQEIVDLDPALMYDAISKGEVDVICAFATDGRIAAYDLRPLRDDRGFFPPYHAAPVIRTEVKTNYPRVCQALGLLGGVLDDSTMQRLNFEVDEKKRSPYEVAHEFLEHQGLKKQERSSGIESPE